MAYLETKVSAKEFITKKKQISFLVLKLIKRLQRDGKFTKFYNLFLRATNLVILKLKNKYRLTLTAFDLYYQIFLFLSPFCNLKNLKASGRTVQVPAPFRFNRLVSTVVGFLVNGFFSYKKRNGYTLQRALRDELLNAYIGSSLGDAYQKKQEFTKNIFANEKNLRFLRSL